MNTITTIETLMMQAVNTKPDTWLNCHGNYIGEALALQTKGLITTRIVDRFCAECFALPNNEFYGEFAARHM